MILALGTPQRGQIIPAGRFAILLPLELALELAWYQADL
jgi:hypothetical protein